MRAKSSVLNFLVGENGLLSQTLPARPGIRWRSILRLNGISLNIADTAGIRKTDDVVEKIGVERAAEYAKNADLILYVVDSSEALTEEDERIMEMIRDKHVIILLNKSDLEQVVSVSDMERRTGQKVIQFSAKNREGMEELEENHF